MNFKLLLIMFFVGSLSGCSTFWEKTEANLPKTDSAAEFHREQAAGDKPIWGSQRKLNMRAESRRRGAAHGRAKMTRDRTSAMLSK